MPTPEKDNLEGVIAQLQTKLLDSLRLETLRTLKEVCLRGAQRGAVNEENMVEFLTALFLVITATAPVGHKDEAQETLTAMAAFFMAAGNLKKSEIPEEIRSQLRDLNLDL